MQLKSPTFTKQIQWYWPLRALTSSFWILQNFLWIQLSNHFLQDFKTIVLLLLLFPPFLYRELQFVFMTLHTSDWFSNLSTYRWLLLFTKYLTTNQPWLIWKIHASNYNKDQHSTQQINTVVQLSIYLPTLTNGGCQVLGGGIGA